MLRDGRFSSPGVALDLRNVRVGKELLFPFAGIDGQVQLEGMTYEGLPRDATVDEWMFLLWTRTAYYSAQPWAQLAAAHSAVGHERDVRRIRIAAQRDLRRRGHLSRWDRVWHVIRGMTVGHGYRPGLALVWLAGVLAVSVGVVLSSGRQPVRPRVDVAAAGPGLGVRDPVRGGLHRFGEAQRVTVGGV